jgi:hypothetical protein
MTNEEHIQFLIKEAEDDFGAAEALLSAGYFGQSLF